MFVCNSAFCVLHCGLSYLSPQANEDVTQIVEIFPSGPSKWNWLTRRLVEFTSSGSVLLFVTKKANAEELANNLKQEDHNLGLLHGDMDQSERNKVISEFKKKGIPILVATDVAGMWLFKKEQLVQVVDISRKVNALQWKATKLASTPAGHSFPGVFQK